MTFERISATRSGFRELFASVGPTLIDLWPTLSPHVRLSMTLATIDELELDKDTLNTLLVAAPEFFSIVSSSDSVDRDAAEANTLAAPSIVDVVADCDPSSTPLAKLLVALRDSNEHSVELWPPAVDFEASVASAIGAAAAQTAWQEMKQARSNVLLQAAINLLLIQLNDPADDDEADEETDEQEQRQQQQQR